MKTISKISLAIAALAFAGHAAAQVTLYEHDGYQGRSVTTERPVNNLERYGFNDRASSVVVRGNRSDRWVFYKEPSHDSPFARLLSLTVRRRSW